MFCSSKHIGLKCSRVFRGPVDSTTRETIFRDAHKFVSRLLINWISNTWWPLVIETYVFGRNCIFHTQVFQEVRGLQPRSGQNLYPLATISVYIYIYIYLYALLPYWLMLTYKQRLRHNGQAYLCSTCIPNFTCLDPIIHYLSLTYRRLPRQEKYV